MMEKSSEVVLSAEERNLIRGNSSLEKSACTSGALSAKPKAGAVPERFRDWYTHKELEKIANEQD